MKTPIYLSVAALLLTANLTVSCNSCEKRQGSELPPNETVTEYDDTAPAPDTIATADSELATPTTVTTPAKATSKRSATANASSKEDSKEGYSAADGTNAENNDGDMYTKNDQKPMPTGPPMK